MLTHESSPIIAIREEELALAQQLAAARRAAEAELQSTRSMAAEQCAEADLAISAEIESDQRAQIARAEEEAAQIVSAGERQAAQIAFDGRKHIAVLVDHIIDFVLPPVRFPCSWPARQPGELLDAYRAPRLSEAPVSIPSE